MHLPRTLARLNRRFNNPLQLRWAGRLRGYGIIEHTGRKSGKAYRTPVNAFRTAEGFAVWIGYGTQSDWVRNLLAADGGHVVHRGRRYEVTAPRIVSGAEARALLPLPARLLSYVTNAKDVLALTAAP